MATDCVLCVEVQGKTPEELEAAAYRHARAFWRLAGAETMFDVDLGRVYPAAWNPGGEVARWQADVEVRLRRK